MSARRDPAQRLAGYLARTLNYDEERQKVMAYGLGALFQMLLLLACSLAFGIIARCAWEAMILFWGVGFLRRSTGGVHCDTYLGCVCVSLTSILRPCGALQIRCSRGAAAVGGNRAGHSAGLCVPDFDRMEKRLRASRPTSRFEIRKKSRGCGSSASAPSRCTSSLHPSVWRFRRAIPA